MTAPTSDAEDDRWTARPFAETLPGVTEIHLDAPAEGNRLTTGMMARLADVIATTAADEGSRVIIITAAGDEFCLGRAAAAPDLGFAPATAAELRAEIEGSLFALFGAIADAPVPVVAVVRGRAVGFGCALAVVCDLTIAGPEAAFELDEMNHGKPPLMALSTLGRHLSEKTLAGMVYTTAPVRGAEAVAAGLANLHAATDGELSVLTTETVERLVGMPHVALATVKRYLRAVADGGASARQETALAMFSRAVAGGDGT